MTKKAKENLNLDVGLICSTLHMLQCGKQIKTVDGMEIIDKLMKQAMILEGEIASKETKPKKDIVTITCYGQTEKKERADAIKFYKECAYACEGCEKERYTNVLLDLWDGKKMAWDGVEPPKGYHVCKYCGGLALGTDKDLLCEECRMDFGHSLFSEL